GRFEHVNPAFAQLTGFTAQELMGRDLSALLSLEARVLFRRQYRRFIASGEGLDAEWTVLDKQGGARVLLAQACRITGPEGGLHSITCVLDITERQAREQLQREKNRVLAQLASSDSLTGLHNRRYILDSLREILLTAARYDR